MEARRLVIAFFVFVIFLFVAIASATADVFRSKNFVVTAPSKEIARQVAEAAEFHRRKQALEWTGKEMPTWFKPCTIQVRVGQIGAGGETSFSFDRGEVYGWRMLVQGTLERIIDSVIPHEVSHTVFACHFRRPLPRWADEGAATLVEHESERRVQQLRLKQVFHSASKYPLKRLLTIKEYPRDMQRVLTLYAQGYSLADFLVQRKGKQAFLEFLNDAHRQGWEKSIRKNYRIAGVEQLERVWSNWFLAGSPRLNLPEGTYLAEANTIQRNSDIVIRTQNPELPVSNRRENFTATDLRGLDLEAPQPGMRNYQSLARQDNFRKTRSKAKIATQNRTREIVPTAGRLQTLKAGWVPVIRKRVKKQTSVARRELSTTSYRNRSRTSVWKGEMRNLAMARSFHRAMNSQ